MKKVLIIKKEANSFERYYSENIRLRGIDCVAPYKYEHGITDFICHVWMHFDLPGYKFFFADWKKNIIECDMVIIFDWIYSHNIVKFIKSKNPKCRVIFWFWNKIEKHMEVKMLSGEDCEYWTFDGGDAEYYHIRQNTQFYVYDFKTEKNEIQSVTEQDVFFCGKDKGRLPRLLKLKKLFDENNIKYDFNVVKDKESNKDIKFEFKSPLSYENIKEKINISRCILDLTNGSQKGLTIRALEALFFSKLLITDNASIKDYDFYDEKKIFLLGERLDLEMVEFIKGPLPQYSYEEKQKYDFNEWLKNFERGEKSEL